MERVKRSVSNVEDELGEIWGLAKENYNSEMEDRMQLQGNSPMPRDELEDLHKKMVALSMQECQKNHSLGFDQKRKLRSALEFQFEKFVEQNNMKAVKRPAIGIDLGTTYCCVGVYLDGKVKMVTNEIGRTTTPSYCAFDGSHYFTGQPAKDQAHINPENTIFDAKRLIGRKFDDRVVQKDIKLWPFEVVRERDIPKIKVDDETYYPEDISARILKTLKKEAEDFLGGIEVTDAVITVPAYFNNSQRQATKDAGAIAGLNVLRILNEPSAAAITYSLHRIDKRKRNVIIFDLGGGTFDVSVLSIEDGNIKIRAVGGDTHLGGEDFDNEMVEYCIREFKKQNGIDLAQGKDSDDFETKFKACKRLRRIRNECEKQKCSLSFAQKATVAMDSIYGSHDLKIVFTRKIFEDLIDDKLSLCIEKVDEVLEDGGLTKDQIEDIVLVGGSSRIPKIQELLSEYFNGKTLFKSIHPDEACAYGAAVQACLLNGHDDSSSMKLKQSVVLSDVLSFSIGVQIRDGDFSVIIPKNTAIPFETGRRYITRYDDQTVMKFPIYEGEEPIARHNHLLGELVLTNINPAPAGEEACDVIMKIDAEGILTVRAVNVNNSDISRNIKISLDTGRLSPDDIYNLQFRGKDKVIYNV